jgi:hypothetical protein
VPQNPGTLGPKSTPRLASLFGSVPIPGTVVIHAKHVGPHCARSSPIGGVMTYVWQIGDENVLRSLDFGSPVLISAITAPQLLGLRLRFL